MSELTAKLTISDGREYDLNVHRAELGAIINFTKIIHIRPGFNVNRHL